MVPIEPLERVIQAGSEDLGILAGTGYLRGNLRKVSQGKKLNDDQFLFFPEGAEAAHLHVPPAAPAEEIVPNAVLLPVD